jgi:hypothetical protein
VRVSGGLDSILMFCSFQDDPPLPPSDKETLRSQLVSAMLTLSRPEDKSIRAQVAEAVSLIAELDFPEKWPNLIDVWRSFNFYDTPVDGSLTLVAIGGLALTDGF